jgi:HAD superfamily hydrolase (TIGR01509 family)
VTDFRLARTRAALLARRRRVRMAIFDCDGVLIDSEAIASRVVVACLADAGWRLTPAEAQARFLGLSIRQMVPMIERQLGRALPEDWTERLRLRMLAALSQEAVAIAGAESLLRATTALGLPWRIASNSSHEEMAAKFARTGLTDLVAGRLHSHRDVARGKPAPDLFLAAAAAEGVAPEDCIVLEDSPPGVQGAQAAGMTVLGFDPQGDGARLAALGALPVHDLAHVPELLGLALAAGT